jgi:phosphatidylserine/phosphatidylglycerophosphate/cardiolipin synthase-like enzyme
LRPYITTSTSSGNVEIYFNNNVNDVTDLPPDGTSFSELMEAIFKVINSAEYSIDVAMYNINRDDIVNALEVAYNKGVRVRYIADADQSNNALDPLPDFPVMFRNGSGIMHNKFMIVDSEDAQNAQVWTGATNFTSNQLSRDPNNAIWIQDQSLARVYEMEFEEMWGSTGSLPNPSLSRTGEAKYDNTPHVLEVGGIPTQVWFSPSDYVADIISGLIDDAESQIDLGLLLITHEELAEDLVKASSEGIAVRGLYNDPEFSGDALDILSAGGVNMQDYEPSSIFHHKYMLVDALDGTDPVLLTGSHNWTYSADNINDENTLVMYDRRLAGLYLDEFESRWAETVTSIQTPSAVQSIVWPNPFMDVLQVRASMPVDEMVIYSTDGRILSASKGSSISTRGLSAGTYLLEVYVSGRRVSRIPVVKLTN